MNKRTVRVAGVTFAKRQETLMGIRNRIKAGGWVDIVLVREPKNEADANAIKVLARYGGRQPEQTKRVMIGYIPKENAAELAPLMDRRTFIKITNFSLSDTKTVGVGLDLEWK